MRTTLNMLPDVSDKDRDFMNENDDQEFINGRRREKSNNLFKMGFIFMLIINLILGSFILYTSHMDKKIFISNVEIFNYNETIDHIYISVENVGMSVKKDLDLWVKNNNGEHRIKSEFHVNKYDCKRFSISTKALQRIGITPILKFVLTQHEDSNNVLFTYEYNGIF